MSAKPGFMANRPDPTTVFCKLLMDICSYIKLLSRQNVSTSMTFQSKFAFRDFVASVRRAYRYIRTTEQQVFLDAVSATAPSRAVPMKPGYILWRAQLGHDLRKHEQDGVTHEIATAHPIARMKPIPGKVSEGRVNVRGIPCLYLATEEDTAIMEVRPLIGSYVSVAQFRTQRALRVVDCSRTEFSELDFFEPNLSAEDIDNLVWSDMNRAFSMPVERGDESLDYIPTQILAETFKLLGFDGVAYKSGYGETGFNVALFDLASADLINCALYSITDVSVRKREEDTRYFVSEHYAKGPKA